VARTDVLLLLGLAAFVALGFVAERVFGLDEPLHLGKLLSLALSAIPALLWLGYFHLQDRVEPEPASYVFGVYLLGAFVAPPLAQLVIDAYPAPAAGGPLGLREALYSFAPVGLAQELAIYVVVRYSIYLSVEFDEPMDGIVYMTAAGIGFATAGNYQALQGMDHTVFLGTGVAGVVVSTLAHGCFAGVLGYALGVARFRQQSSRVIFLGLVVAALLNGGFHLLEARVAVSGMGVAPWRALAFAAVFAAAVFAVTLVLMRRHLAASPFAEGRHA
jgi:RsiW-degrading membrane proteinase PrsW (M82 family)